MKKEEMRWEKGGEGGREETVGEGREGWGTANIKANISKEHIKQVN